MSADVQNELGPDVSGLYYQGSGSATPGVLWAVDNGSYTMLRLIWNGSLWVRDPNNGWAAGKKLVYPSGTGRPDAEGITMTDAGPAGGAFVSVESDTTVAVSRIAILRYDVSGNETTLTATREWNLTPDLPAVGRNQGAESVEWIPDAYLTGRRLIDQNTGQPYNPANYPNHGSGLFFIGLEANGQVYGYALDQTSGGYTRIVTFASGFTTFASLHWDGNKRQLWTVCDNNCEGRSRVFEVDGNGAFALTAEYDRPTAMPNYNNEGFAMAPDSECVNGRKPVWWADDGNDEGHALRSASIQCTPPENDLLVDFGSSGAFLRLNNQTWVKLRSTSPLAMATGDLDGSGKDETILSYDAGLFARYDNAGTWRKIRAAAPVNFVAGNLDGQAGEDLVANFGSAGTWVFYNNATWTKINAAPAERLAVGDFDADGKSDVLASFPGYGLFIRLNNATWKKIDARVARHVAVGDLDGNGKADAVADFGADGIWAFYDGTTAKKLNNAMSEGLQTGDLDGNGQDEILAALGSSGLWMRLNDTNWVKIRSASPVYMATADLDGNGKDELIADFGAPGILIRKDNGTWVRLGDSGSEGIYAGRFD